MRLPGSICESTTAMQVHDIIEELHLTTLDESDIEAAFREEMDGSSDADVIRSSSIRAEDDNYDGYSDQEAGSLFDRELQSSLSSALTSVDVSTTDVDVGFATSTCVEKTPRTDLNALENRLRLGIASSTAGIPDLQSVVNSQRWYAEILNLQGQLEAARRSCHLQPDADREGRQHGQKKVPTESADTAAASAAIRSQLNGDLNISDSLYQILVSQPREELSIIEVVQIRVHEVQNLHKAESERMRNEIESLRESLVSVQTSSQRTQRQLFQRDAAFKDLNLELEQQMQQHKTQYSQLMANFRASEQKLEENQDKAMRFDAVVEESKRIGEEVETLKDAVAVHKNASQQVKKDLLQSTERLTYLEGKSQLLEKDAESHERRARLMEDTLARRDEQVAELKSKVESLRDKKRELARKADTDHATVANETREHVQAEIKRMQEQAQNELEKVRQELNELHHREVNMLKERLGESENRSTGLQRRLDDEEQKHQSLQLSYSRCRAELQNEITELSSTLKLRAFELDRAVLTHEEVSKARQRLDVENEQLKQQVGLLKNEYYNLEVKYREEKAEERAELTLMRERVRGYETVERELGSARNSSIAQELQSRVKESVEAKTALASALAKQEELAEELETTRKELRYSSEPQAYLLEALRRRETDVLGLQRELRAQAAESERLGKQVELAAAAKLEAEGDLWRLLKQREQMANLHILGEVCKGDAPSSMPTDLSVPRAEHRGRAPTQNGHARAQANLHLAPEVHIQSRITDSGNPTWFEKLRLRVAKTDTLA